ncbi:MAG: FecR domain-containing protein [Chitinophagaceae bacterium]|nr:FecR domain-containing protein [Chitinophagaceae bacterium]
MKNRLSIENKKDAFDAQEKTNNVSGRPLISVIGFSNRFRRVAAVLILILTGASLYFLSNNKNLEQTTAYGESKNFVLPDGSEVSLNANSGLTTTKTWDKTSSREVWLKGEAFFHVKHTSSNQHFIVHTDNGDVEVLGTTFNVYNRGGKTQVVLTSGKVKIITSNTKDTLLLLPGEMAELSKTKLHVSKTVNTEKITSWKKNVLFFDNTSLQEIAVLIKDNYGYKVVWANENIKKLNFTYTLVGNDLDLLLNTLEEALDIKAKLKGNLIYIDSK